LLHGSTKVLQGSLGIPGLHHHYQPEDPEELERLLRPGTYHAVVANPPYITPKDRGLNEKYRERYSACHMKYSLAVPFMQRIFDLACEDGFTGQITANSFMKREFGKKLITEFFPTVDLTHVIDTSGAYIPGHGTPTVILFGRNRPPVASTIRTVMGIRGEPSTPDDPAQGQVWTAILKQIDQTGSQSAFVSVADSPRENFHKHPWSIGGGGAAELKERLDEAEGQTLADWIEEIGVLGMTNADEVMLAPRNSFCRRGVEQHTIRRLALGDEVRDWTIGNGDFAIFPYPNEELIPIVSVPGLHRWLWPTRTILGSRATFARLTYFEEGRPWWEWHQLTAHRLRTSLTIVFGEVATHNHFVLDRGGKVFKQTAPVIKLPAAATEDDYLALLGLLNSSTACFWMKQVSTCKGLGGQGGGIKPEDWHRAYAFNGTKLLEFPVPARVKDCIPLARRLDALAAQLKRHTPSQVLSNGVDDLQRRLNDVRQKSSRLYRRAVALQEELDWLVYNAFGISDYSPTSDEALEIGLHPQDRPAEVLLRRAMDNGSPSIYYDVHQYRGAEQPGELHPHMRCCLEGRLALLECNANLKLIETVNHKRRWQVRPWEDLVEQALYDWLLDRLESYFDLDGRMNDAGRPTAQIEVSLLSTAKLADLAGRDPAFQPVAELYRGRPDFDVVRLVTELIEAESVPLLPLLRYRPSGLDKRRAWERTWQLQRQEDAIDRRATLKGVSVNDGGWKAATDDGQSPLNPAQADLLKKEKVGPIPPPPKYKSADFQNGDFWRLRGGLDVPKERWVSFPQCEGADGLPLVAWAGYDHLQLAKAIAAHYVHVQEQEGGRDDPRLVPLLACLIELLPWLKQWHNKIDPEFNMGMGDYYEGFVQDEARQMNKTIEQVRAWQPAAKMARGRVRKASGQLR
jgi:hypothetical protein